MIKKFFSIFRYGLNSFLNLKIIIILFVLLIFTLVFLQYNISEYEECVEQKRIFQDLEKKKVDQFLNYRYYGARGFRLFFQPDPISIFFINSVPLPNMNAFADNTEQLNFYKPINTKTVFELRKNWFTDYSGILLLIGSLLSLFYGFQTFRNPEYLRILCTIVNPKKLFWYVFSARVLLVFLVLLIFMVFSILLIVLNGFMIPVDKYILTFLFMCLGVLLLTFSVGLFCGTMKSTLSGILIALLIWSTFIFFIPTLQNIITTEKAKAVAPIYQLEMDKLIIYMDWERKMREKEGIRKVDQVVSDSVKKRMLAFKQNELKKLQQMEEDQIAQLESNKRIYQLISSFFPTTFYQSLNNEISSRGYNNLADFCKFALKQKLQFIGLIIEKEYFSNYSKVEQFNADDDNVYKAHPCLPEFFLLGIFFNLLWIAAFALPSFYLFKKDLSEVPEKRKEEIEPDSVNLNRNEIRAWRVYSKTLGSLFYNVLANSLNNLIKKGYSFNVTLDGQPLNSAKKAQNFLYLCHLSSFPPFITTGIFIDLIMGLMNVDKTKRAEIKNRFSLNDLKKKKISQLEISEIGRIYLAVLEMKHFPIYLIDDITRGMSMEFCYALRRKLIDLYDAGALILFISSQDNYLRESKSSMRAARESLRWFRDIEEFENEELEKTNDDWDESENAKPANSSENNNIK